MTVKKRIIAEVSDDLHKKVKKIGILKGGNRKEAMWNQTKLGEPYKKALNRFRNEVLPRDDFGPTSLLQFGLEY